MSSEPIDVGCGTVEITTRSDDPERKPWGLIWEHPDKRDPTRRCSGCLSWHPSEPPDKRWHLISLEPLTLSPSLNCTACGQHGFIENGRWRSA